MANDNWPIWTTTTSSTMAAAPLVVSIPANYTYSYGPVSVGSAGPPAPNCWPPPALAEDELAWLRRRVTEITDLFPVAA